MSSNWLLQVAYDGTVYRGWQRQRDAGTVQGELEQALTDLFGCDLRVSGCSRTDAGVHALAQQVSLCVPEYPPIPPNNARKALNDRLPDDICVRSIEVVSADFHARFSNVGKAYVYLLAPHAHKHPFLGRFSWTMPRNLALAEMQRAAAALIGTHDFTTFSCVADRDDAGNTRTLYQCRVEELDGLLVVKVVGDGFLYRMVRRIVGFLVGVGSGRISPEDTGRLLAARDRNGGFCTAPPQGLFLYDVFFDEDQRDSWELEVMPLLFPPRP